jgi:hypothetical protein
VNPRGTPQRIRRGQLADQGTHVRRYAWTPRAASAFPGPEQSKTASMPRHDVSGVTMCTAVRQPRQACASEAHRRRSADVRRRRGRRDRLTTANRCRSAMISRCSEARDRTTNRSEWSSETTTDDTTSGYRRTPATSIDATCTEFSVATGCSAFHALNSFSSCLSFWRSPIAMRTSPASSRTSACGLNCIVPLCRRTASTITP